MDEKDNEHKLADLEINLAGEDLRITAAGAISISVKIADERLKEDPRKAEIISDLLTLLAANIASALEEAGKWNWEKGIQAFRLATTQAEIEMRTNRNRETRLSTFSRGKETGKYPIIDLEAERRKRGR